MVERKLLPVKLMLLSYVIILLLANELCLKNKTYNLNKKSSSSFSKAIIP